MSLAIQHDSMMDAAAVVRDTAARVLRSANGIGASDRQWLHDIKRDRVNIRNEVRLLELVTYADLADALYSAERRRGFVIAHKQPAVPFWADASRDEEVANHVGNLAQYGWTETRSASAADTLCEAMSSQELRSRILADAVRVHLTGRRSIHVISR